ncbi:MAG: hypothetical protein ACKV2U_07540 [Bryobacteraceae bacterium]
MRNRARRQAGSSPTEIPSLIGQREKPANTLVAVHANINDFWRRRHGAGQSVSRYLQSRQGKTAPRSLARWHKFGTLQFDCFCWIFFRAADWAQAMLVLERIASLTVAWDNVSIGLWIVLGLAVAGHYAPKSWTDWPRERFAAAPFYAQAAGLLALAIAIKYVAATGAAPFIDTKL